MIPTIPVTDLHSQRDALLKRGQMPLNGLPNVYEQLENIEFLTVGIDIGSATSMVMFATVRLRRMGNNYSSKFEIIDRNTIAGPYITMTPMTRNNSIDQELLGAFLAQCYMDAGIKYKDIDTGLVLLTGVATERENAKAISRHFADTSGKFVCASAGHHLEAILAAYGSGSVASSQLRQDIVVNIDIGGGTTKFTLIQHGAIISTLAIPGGGRLISWDEHGVIERVELLLSRTSCNSELIPEIGDRININTVQLIARSIVDDILTVVFGPRVYCLLDGTMCTPVVFDRILISGGVGSLTFKPGYGEARRTDYHNDLGMSIASELSHELTARRVSWEQAPATLTATAIGLSQFSVQVSGNTIFLDERIPLPLVNIPVVVVDIPNMPNSGSDICDTIHNAVRTRDLIEPSKLFALALRWDGVPRYSTLRTIAEGVVTAMRVLLPEHTSIILVSEHDIAQTIGSILAEEISGNFEIMAIDNLRLSDFDYIDIGEVIRPAGVVPIIVKTLLFTSPNS